jgi:hypothetical protein
MKTGNFKEQAKSGVYENGKFQRMNELGPGLWKPEISKIKLGPGVWKWVISKNEQAGSKFMKMGNFKEKAGSGYLNTGNFKERTSWVQVLKPRWRASMS